jgi:uncharacterized protein YceK
MKKSLLMLVYMTTLSGCAVVSVADAVVSTTVDVAVTAVDVTTDVIGAVVPDGDDAE